MKIYFEELNAQQMRRDNLDWWIAFYKRHKPIFDAGLIVGVCLGLLFGFDPMETVQ